MTELVDDGGFRFQVTELDDGGFRERLMVILRIHG